MAEDIGMTEMAETPSRVVDAIVAAIEAGEYHVFTDVLAKILGNAYRSYAGAITEVDLMAVWDWVCQGLNCCGGPDSTLPAHS